MSDMRSDLVSEETYYVLTYLRLSGYWCPISNARITHVDIAIDQARKHRERGILGKVRVEKHTLTIEVVE